jgi:TRAP-type transport system periplasmic protein
VERAKKYVAARLDRQGLMLLHGVIWPGQSLFTRKAINSFDDIKGLKFRVQDPNTSRLAQLIGVTGVRVETADIPQAFLTGIIDGMFTSNATTADLKGWDYIKFAYETNAWYPLNITFVNKGIWAKLSEKDRKVILDASAKAEERGWGMEVEETRTKTKLLKDNGVAVVVPPPALLKEFQAAGRTMLADWKKKAGADGAKLLAEFEKRRGQ